MSKMAQLKQWISDLLPHGGYYERYVQVVTEEGESNEDKSSYEHKYIVRIFTKSRHYFYIVAKDRSEDDGYLGCQAGASYHLAGEDHTRGNDLPDGPFNADTWRKILNAMVARELRELGT